MSCSLSADLARAEAARSASRRSGVARFALEEGVQEVGHDESSRITAIAVPA